MGPQSGDVTLPFSFTDGQVLQVRDVGADAMAEVVSLVFDTPSATTSSTAASCGGGGDNQALASTITTSNWDMMREVGGMGSGHARALSSIVDGRLLGRCRGLAVGVRAPIVS